MGFSWPHTTVPGFSQSAESSDTTYLGGKARYKGGTAFQHFLLLWSFPGWPVQPSTCVQGHLGSHQQKCSSSIWSRAHHLPAPPPARTTPRTPSRSRAPSKNYFPAWPSLHPEEEHPFSNRTACSAGFLLFQVQGERCISLNLKLPITVFTLLVFTMKLYRRRKGDLRKK